MLLHGAEMQHESNTVCPCPAGLLQYSHEKGEKGGSLSFKFNLVDPEGNKLIDQSFFISVLGMVSSPLCYLNKGWKVPSSGGEKKAITPDLSLCPAAHWCASSPRTHPEYESCGASVCTSPCCYEHIVVKLTSNSLWKLVSFHFKKPLVLPLMLNTLFLLKLKVLLLLLIYGYFHA